jgi:hypothetical protein
LSLASCAQDTAYDDDGGANSQNNSANNADNNTNNSAPSDRFNGPEGDLARAIDERHGADPTPSAWLLGEGAGAKDLRGTLRPDAPVLGYLARLGPGARVTVTLTLEGDPTPRARHAIYGPWGSTALPGARLVQQAGDEGTPNAEPLQLEIQEEGRYLVAFTAYDFARGDVYQLKMTCEGEAEACNPDLPPLPDPEGQDPATCGDGLDNDQDGQTDCDDAGCPDGEATGCGGVPTSPEDNNQACQDGLDNDEDGQTDCGDPGCAQNPDVDVCQAEAEAGLEQCQDSLDNDGDGRADCDDPGCAQDPEVLPCRPTPEDSAQACADGDDNDRDGFEDCRDFDCQQAGLCGEPEEGLEACQDGLDNDLDGFTDCADFGCQGNPELTACLTERSDADCSDGVDNDQDGYTDCRDFDCSRNEDVTVCAQEATNASCADGVDNDGDGFTDCRDFDCSRNEDVTVCEAVPETSDALCQDGDDNDLDGSTDCVDADCAAARPCQADAESSDARCDDEVDNDGDGLTDCEDPDCVDNPNVVACDPPGEMTQAQCSDRRDNDADGRVDCDDIDCALGGPGNGCAPLQAEQTDALCDDGLDNDRDGATDCDDPSCAAPGVGVCASVLERGDVACSDRQDNDRDGFVDCADTDCALDPEVTVCVTEDTAQRCDDGLDNDGDGFTDCEDYNCLYADAFRVCEAPTTTPEDTALRCRDGLDNDGDGQVDCDEPACDGFLEAAECGPNPFLELLGLQGQSLRVALLGQIDDHTVLSYERARDAMYGITGQIDVVNGQIECVYTGGLFVPDGTRTPGEINTEHSWPRSLGASEPPAISDIHHLFPATENSNSARLNHPYGETRCDQTNTCSWSGGGSMLGRDGAQRLIFEVRPAKRGDIARAQFYFSVRYGLAIPPEVEPILRRWNDEDPPDAQERIRTRRIAAFQRNLNPFVLHPNLVDAISDF